MGLIEVTCGEVLLEAVVEGWTYIRRPARLEDG